MTYIPVSNKVMIKEASYRSGHILLNLSNKMGANGRTGGHLIIYHNKLNKFNST